VKRARIIIDLVLLAGIIASLIIGHMVGPTHAQVATTATNTPSAIVGSAPFSIIGSDGGVVLECSKSDPPGPYIEKVSGCKMMKDGATLDTVVSAMLQALAISSKAQQESANKYDELCQAYTAMLKRFQRELNHGIPRAGAPQT
jgi:hypothetical protein